jgi:hypothetical protein
MKSSRVKYYEDNQNKKKSTENSGVARDGCSKEVMFEQIPQQYKGMNCIKSMSDSYMDLVPFGLESNLKKMEKDGVDV